MDAGVDDRDHDGGFSGADIPGLGKVDSGGFVKAPLIIDPWVIGELSKPDHVVESGFFDTCLRPQGNERFAGVRECLDQ